MPEALIFDDSEAPDDNNYECPPKGLYELEVKDADWPDGKTYILLYMEVSTGPYTGAKVRDYLNMRGKGAGITKKKAQAFGLGLVKGMEVAPAPFIGKRVRAYLIPDSYKKSGGKTYTNPKVDINQGTHCGYLTDAAGAGPVGEGTEDDDFSNLPF